MPSEQTIRDIKRKTRKQYSAEEKIRIVLDGLRGDETVLSPYPNVPNKNVVLSRWLQMKKGP